MTHAITNRSFLLCCFRFHLNVSRCQRVERTLGCDRWTARENLRTKGQRFMFFTKKGFSRITVSLTSCRVHYYLTPSRNKENKEWRVAANPQTAWPWLAVLHFKVYYWLSPGCPACVDHRRHPEETNAAPWYDINLAPWVGHTQWTAPGVSPASRSCRGKTKGKSLREEYDLKLSVLGQRDATRQPNKQTLQPNPSVSAPPPPPEC